MAVPLALPTDGSMRHIRRWTAWARVMVAFHRLAQLNMTQQGEFRTVKAPYLALPSAATFTLQNFFISPAALWS